MRNICLKWPLYLLKRSYMSFMNSLLDFLHPSGNVQNWANNHGKSLLTPIVTPPTIGTSWLISLCYLLASIPKYPQICFLGLHVGGPTTQFLWNKQYIAQVNGGNVWCSLSCVKASHGFCAKWQKGPGPGRPFWSHMFIMSFQRWLEIIFTSLYIIW